MKGKVRDMIKTKCYFIYDDDNFINGGKLEEVTEEEFSRAIEGYGLSGYPIYINGYMTDICIYTAVEDYCAVLIGCRIYNDVTYTVNDIKKLNRLGLVGKKIYDKCTIEV